MIRIVWFKKNNITNFADFDGFQHSHVSQLFQNQRHIKFHWSLVTIGFDTSHKVGMALRHQA